MTATRMKTGASGAIQVSDGLHRLTTLYQASLAINRATNEDEVVQAVVKQLSYGEFDRGLVLLYRDRPEPRAELRSYWDRASDTDQAVPPVSWMDSARFGSATQIWNDIAQHPEIYRSSREHFAQMGIHATATIPLKTSDAALGALVLEMRRPYTITPEFLEPYEALAFHAATVMQNRRLLRTERRRVEQLNSLVLISQAFGAIADLEQTFQELTRSLARILGAQRCLVALFQPETGFLVGQAPAFGWPDPVARSLRGPAGDLLPPEPLYSNDPPQGLAEQQGALISHLDPTSILMAALPGTEAPVGMLIAADKPGGFGPGDVQLASVLGNQAAVVIRNGQLYQEQQRRVREMEILNQIAAATTSSMELDELLDQTLVRLTTVFDCDCGLISLWDESRENLYLTNHHQLPESLEAALSAGNMNQTLCALTATRAAPLIAGDVSAVTEAPTQKLVEAGIRSCLGAPLVARGELLGTLCIFSREPDHFTQANSAMLGAVGQQVGLAVNNAMRYEEAQRRAIQVQTAAEVSSTAAAEMDQQSMLQSAVDLIRYRFGYYHVSIFVLDEDRQWAVVKASTGDVGRKMMDEPHKLPVGGQSIVGRVTGTGQAHIALDVGEDAVHFENPLLPHTRSEMALPLIARGQILGALDVQSNQPAAFNQDDVAILQSMADQIAVAQQNARFRQELAEAAAAAEQQANRFAALLQVYQQVQTLPDLESQIQAIAQGVLEANLYHRAVVSVLDDNWQIAYRGFAGLTDQEIEALISAPAPTREDRMRRHDERFRVSNSYFIPSGQDPTSHLMVVKSHRGEEHFDDWHPDDMLIVPLQIGGRLVGVISVDDPLDGKRPTEDSLIPLELFAGLAARLIENQLLFAEMQQLYEVTSRLSQVSSLKELSELLAASTRDLVNAQGATVFLVDHRRRQVLQQASAGDPFGGEKRFSYDEVWQDLAGEVLRTQKPILSSKADDPRLSQEAQQARRAAGVGSLMILPLRAADEVIGQIMVSNRADQRQFTESDLEALTTLTTQAGTTITNLRLLSQAQRRALQLQTAAEISRATSSVQDMESLFSDIIELIRDRFDYRYVGLYLVDEARRSAVLQAGTGEAGEQLLQEGHRLAINRESPVGRVVTRPEVELFSLEQAAGLPYLPGPEPGAAFPLVSQDEVIGALVVQGAGQGAFSEEDVSILVTTADQLANTISNLRLLSRLQASLEEIERRERGRVQEDWGILAMARDSEGKAGYEYDLMEVRPGLVDGSERHAPVLAEPLFLRGEVIGALGIEAESPDYRWTEDEIAIVNAVAAQVAQAMDRAYHSEQSERRASQLETAAQVGQAVASAAMLTAGELMQRAVALISELFGFHHVAIFLLEKEGDRAVVQAAAGHAARVMEESFYSVSMEAQSPVACALRERLPYIALDVAPGSWMPHPLIPETRSEIAVPLLSGGQLLGAVDIHSTQAAAFDQVYAAVLHTVADQIASALVNARLFEETRQRAADQQLLFEATTAAVTTEDIDQMLQNVAQAIFDRMDCTEVAVLTIEGEVLRQRAGVGEIATLMTSRAAEIQMGEGIIGWVAQTGEPLIAADVSLSEHYLAKASRTRSELAVPIVVEQEVGGVINVESDRLNAFDDDDLRLLQTLSSTLGSIVNGLRLMERLQAAYEEIREIDQLKSEFLANMSHELRTPLNSIIGFSRVILKGIDGPITPLQEQDLTSIYDSGKHLLGLINNVLDLSKIEAGKMELAPEVVSVREAINVVMSTAVGLVKDKEVELIQHVPEDLPPAWVDPIRLRQVMLNLVSNAAKFTEKGSITIQAAYDPQAVFVQFIDTGIGISEEDMDKLFKSFSQVDASSTRRAGGSGLGLAISAQLMEMQGGRIWVESELGVGSTFSVAIPRVNPEESGPVAFFTEMAPEEPAGEPGPELEPLEAPNGPQLVLVIEDEEGVVNLFRRYLEGDGYRVESAARGDEGIEMAVELADQLAAITVDIMMPDIDGWDIIRQLREHPATADLPIIICSIVLDQARAKEMRVNKYLIKPILQEDLLSALQEVRPVRAVRME